MPRAMRPLVTDAVGARMVRPSLDGPVRRDLATRRAAVQEVSRSSDPLQIRVERDGGDVNVNVAVVVDPPTLEGSGRRTREQRLRSDDAAADTPATTLAATPASTEAFMAVNAMREAQPERAENDDAAGQGAVSAYEQANQQAAARSAGGPGNLVSEVA